MPYLPNPDHCADIRGDLGGDPMADRHLVGRLRRAVLGTIAAVVLMFVLVLPGGMFLLDTFIARNQAIVTIELTGDRADHTAFVADRLLRAGTPQAADKASERLLAARADFLATYADLRAMLDRIYGPGTASLGTVFTDAPHDLDRRVASFSNLVDKLAAARDPSLRQLLAERLGIIARTGFRPGLDQLRADQAAQTARLVRGFELAGTAICLIVLTGLLAQWFHSYRPVAEGLLARARALVAANEALRRAGLTDPLTGLPNRDALLQELASRIAAGRAVVVLHVDLHRFGMVNDTLGRDVGDRLLCHAAAVMAAAAGPRDMIARIAGDEFALLPEQAGGMAPTRALAARVMADLARPVTINGHDLTARSHVGIAAMAPADADPGAPLDVAQVAARAERLLTDAEIALAAAPASGGCASFTTQMRHRLQIRRATAQQLLRALERDEIQPYFQPQICARTARLTGVEALARWHHPVRGTLSPGDFLDIAAGASLSQAINDVIVARSLAWLAAWRAQGLDVPSIGLNFAADHLRGAQVVDRLLFDVDRAGLQPRDVVVEVLESALIVDASDPILTTVAGLSRAGFRIDIDDFGTGHASFLNLRLLAPNRLKIDRSFVRGMTRDAELRKMTDAMIRLAATLGIESLAEGVETVEEWAQLTRLGCTALQGFAIARPMRGEDVAHWTARHTVDLAAGRLIRVA